MDWKRIAEQMKGIYTKMSVAERVTVGLTVALVLTGLLAVIAWGTRPEYVPVLPQAFTIEEAQTVTEALDEVKIPYQYKDDRILVPANRREEARLALASGEALPSRPGFDQLLESIGPFPSPAVQDRQWLILTKSEIERTIERMKRVRSVRVLITPGVASVMAGTNRPAEAVVHLDLKGGSPLSEGELQAIRNIVSYSVPLMEPQNVAVSDSDRSYPAPVMAGSAVSGALLVERMVRDKERYVSESIERALGRTYPGTRAVVRIVYEQKESEERVEGANTPEGRVASEEIEEARTEQAGGETPPAGVRGTGQDVGEGQAGTSSRESTTNTRTEYLNQMIFRREVDHSPFQATGLTVHLEVPQKVALDVRGDLLLGEDGQPRITDLTPEEIEQCREVALTSGGLTDKAGVTVMTFVPQVELPPSFWERALEAGRTMADELMLGALALVGIGMLWSLAKRALPAKEEVVEELPPQPSPDDLAREAETRKEKEIEDRVREVVVNNPRLAAGLVKRWLLERSE